jgi:Family of unknown function (DUF6491)
MTIRGTVLLAGVAILSGAAQADLGARKTVDRITDASAIDAYQYLDPIHLLLTVDTERHYRLTFDAPCNPARFADRIDISRSDDEIHAGFDYVVVAGVQCRINTIEAL